ncbi:cilia- and flagella-associated protein 47, partial [Arapaima gigas]
MWRGESWEGGAAEHLGRTSDWGASDGTSDRTGTLGLPCSPPGGSGEGLFFRSVRGATQRWFVQFGWPRGPNPVTIPHAVRRAVCKVRASGSRRTGCSPGPVQETRTVYDMVLHLCGQLPPGVGGGLWLPGSAPERVQQLHRRHGALLAFLSDQGASLSHVCPEHLMEPQDFRLWLSLQDQQDVLVTGSMKLDDVDFESLSSRVWTDVLLQTYKARARSALSVFVLPRVTKSSWEGLQSCENEDHLPGPDFDPLARNMFSTWERRLLSWLNCSYQRMRLTVWDPEIYPG